EIIKRLGDVVYGSGDKDLAQVVAKLLLKNKFTLAVAESCTGGFLANWITDNSGSSKYFERGVVTYSDQSKKDILDVSLKVLNKYGAVSKETAIAMARGLKKISGADIAVSITGVAGPAGGSKDKPVGTVFIGMATPEDDNAWEFHYPRDRKAFKQLVAATALNVVRLFLLKR
ncbi:nicotinamide-nucleotide amidohydrolase family protein, partial [bacterium]|nr:nicotinamide-nucleotide amidohydrolase family protein [bacterium]